MRLLRPLAPVACVAAMLVAHIDSSNRALPGGQKPQLLAQRGEADILYAAPGDLNSAYGPQGEALNRLRVGDRVGDRAGNQAGDQVVGANFVVTYNGFDPQSQAAFQAAIDIWSNTIVSPAPIRIIANWT